MKGKIKIVVDGRLKFTRTYNSSNERKEIMGAFKLQYQQYDIEFTIAPCLSNVSTLLSEWEQAEINELKGIKTAEQIANMYGVSKTTIGRIHTGIYNLPQRF